MADLLIIWRVRCRDNQLARAEQPRAAREVAYINEAHSNEAHRTASYGPTTRTVDRQECLSYTKILISFSSRRRSRSSAAFSKSRFFAASFISFVSRAMALSRSSS